VQASSGTLCRVTKNDLATDAVEPEGPSRREQAVARSLDSARLRAEGRVQRFLDAAMELFNSRPGRDFTVQEVVERSGQSLHSFYQYFGGKHELLLALFEEQVRSTTERLRQVIAREDDPLERLHVFVVAYYWQCRPTDDSPPKEPGATDQKRRAPLGMAEFAQQLLTEHPKEAARVFSPLVSVFEEVLEEATTSGAVRPGLRRGPIVGIVLEAIMFNTFSATIGGLSLRSDDGDPAEDLWSLILHGIGKGSAD
jgi:AcrR family transcriptional regulator